MRSTLLLSAALFAAAMPAAAQETRPLEMRVPATHPQSQSDEEARHQARRRWNAAHDDDHHARRRWNAANPPPLEVRPQRLEPSRPAVQRHAAGSAGGRGR
jgi:transposase